MILHSSLSDPGKALRFSIPVIVTLCVLHPKGIVLKALQVPPIDLSHHVLGLPEAWLAADGPAQKRRKFSFVQESLLGSL